MKGYIRIEQAPDPGDLPEGAAVLSGLMITADCELTALERWTVVQQLGEALHFTWADWEEVITMVLQAGPYAGLRTDQYEIGTFTHEESEE